MMGYFVIPFRPEALDTHRYDSLFAEAGKKYQVDPALVKAVAGRLLGVGGLVHDVIEFSFIKRGTRNLSSLGQPTKLLQSVKSHSADDFKCEREEIVP